MSSAILLLAAVLLIPTAVAEGVYQRQPWSQVKHVDELFNRNCARCHGSDGRGETPLGQVFKAPNFTDPEWWKTNSSITGTRSLRSIVIRGKAGMPAFGKKLTRSEINLLVDRVRTFRRVKT